MRKVSKAVELDGCCPFQPAFDLLSRRHALTIIWYLQRGGAARFNDIKRSIAVNPVTLSERLEELEKAGVVSRKQFKQTPPRVEYALTPMGRELLPLIDQMGRWAERNHMATA